VNKVRELGLKVRYLSGGKKAIPGVDTDLLWSEVDLDAGVMKARGPRVIEAERFDNLRSQVWWRMREDLRQGRVALPNDPELWQDLTSPTYTTTGGKIVVEEKKKIQARLRRSPNKGDAACYGNFVRRRALDGPGEAAIPIAAVSRNRDSRLEKVLAAREKRQRVDEAKFRRLAKVRKRRSA